MQQIYRKTPLGVPKNTPGWLLLYKLSLTSNKLKIYSGKPDTPCTFTYEKNIISKRKNKGIVRQISNRIRTNYYHKTGNI